MPGLYSEDIIVITGSGWNCWGFLLLLSSKLLRIFLLFSSKLLRILWCSVGEVDDESDIPQDRDWSDYWRLLFKKVSVDDIKTFEKDYKGMC